MEIIWHGPVYDPSGYANSCREYIYALHEYGVKVKVQPIRFWSPIETPAVTGEQLDLLRELENTPVKSDTPRVWQTVPDCYSNISKSRPEIGYTVFESNSIPMQWVEKMNKMSHIFVPCRFNVETFERGGFDPKKMSVIPHVVDTQFWDPEKTTMLNIPYKTDFTFLTVLDVTERKGWKTLLRAYIREFAGEDNVSLVFKGYYGGVSESHQANLRKRIIDFVKTLKVNKPPKIIFYGDILDEVDMPRLFKSCDAFVLPHRGEGWGLNLSQAMAMGMPTIATNWSGNLEFMNNKNSYLIDILNLVDITDEMQKITPNYTGQKWAEPSEHHLRQIMRYVFQNRDEAKKIGEKARRDMKNKFNRKTIAKKIVNAVEKITQ